MHYKNRRKMDRQCTLPYALRCLMVLYLLHFFFISKSELHNLEIRRKERDATGIRADDFNQFYMESKQFELFRHPFPCLNESIKDSDKNKSGLHFIKVHKTASSTVAHIVKYIANKRGGCLEYSNHAPAYFFESLNGRKSNQRNSYLFTFVRDPTKRAISDFFYRKVTQEREEVNLVNFRSGCCRSRQHLNGQAGYQLAYISTDKNLPEYTFWNNSNPEKVLNPNLLLGRINNIFESYDFIGVSERLNESLVVLSFLLNLSLSEIAYVSYRQSGSFLEVNKKCVKIVESHLTPDIEEYLDSEEWKARTAGDRFLHKSAMEALDNTINNVIGKDLFLDRLREYELLLKFMKQCESECSSNCADNGQYRGAVSCRPCMNQARKKWDEETKKSGNELD